MYDRPLTDEEYGEMDDQPRRIVPGDPVGEALGAQGYLARHTLHECVERFDGSPITRHPEVFDRFYFNAADGPTLVDIIYDGNPDTLEAERARKRVDFKQQWCALNERRYLALPSSACEEADRIRVLLAVPEEPVELEPKSKPPARRGQVQRPKAAASAA